jgi:cysteine desulfurase
VTRSYLDHASTTPMSPSALDAYLEVAAQTGNPSSLHSSGRNARRIVEESREIIAAGLGARPSEVIFTSGGTEANNLALKGIYWARCGKQVAAPGSFAQRGEPSTHHQGRAAAAASPGVTGADRSASAEALAAGAATVRPRILVLAVEHRAVLDPAMWLAESAGAEVVQLPVDRFGVVRLGALRSELERSSETTALVSLMWANNEVGTIEPIAEAAEIARSFGVPIHTDAVQAVGQLPVNFAEVGVDAMTISGHKIGGPVGVGALIARRGLAMEALAHGGGQERGVRSGTLDTASVRALAVAVQEATTDVVSRASRLAELQERLIAGIREAVPGAVLRGPEPGPGRLPGSIHFTFPGTEGDSLLYLLDTAQIEASTGSACQAGIPQPSHVLMAMGVPESEARGALRFTLGSTSTVDDVERTIAAIPTVVARAQLAGQF